MIMSLSLVIPNSFHSYGINSSNLHSNRRKLYKSMKVGSTQVNVGRDEVETHNNSAQIRAMDKYTKSTMTDPSIAPEARSLCSNNMGECAYYASNGMCFSDIIFMMNNCPMACMMCEASEEFNRCIGKRHPFNNPIFVKNENFEYIEQAQAEDLGFKIVNFLFEILKLDERATVIPSKDTKSIEVSDPYIIQIDDFLSPEECDELIALATKDGWKNSAVNKLDHFDGTHEFQLPLRSSESVACNKSDMECFNASSSVIQKLSALARIPSRHFEPVDMIHYPPGGYYTAHHDYRRSDAYKPAGPRVLTMYIALSEASSGGSVGFPDLDWLLVKPKRGSILMWPNVEDALDFDATLKNEIMPVQEGDLFLLQTHVHLYDYADAQESGCN